MKNSEQAIPREAPVPPLFPDLFQRFNFSAFPLLLRATFSRLSRTSCRLHHEWNQLQISVPPVQTPLFAEYHLGAIRRSRGRETLALRNSRWRYREGLPLPHEVEPISLGEGGTPLLRAERFGEILGIS